MNRGPAVVFVLLLSLPSFAINGANRDASPANPFAAYDAELSHTASMVLDRAGQPDSPPSMKPNRIPQHETISRGKTAAWQRVEKLRPLLEPILRSAEVPPAFSAVALVESGGNPAALSPKGARGLWQLMPNTARRYGLEVSVNRDERLDVVKSSRAAAHYLHDLYVRFGTWALALAAYNAGEDAVQRGLDRAGAKDFFSLSRLKFLPEETRKYVPAVFSSMKLFDDSVPVPDSSRRPAIGGVVSYALSQPQQ